jgi:hypothetical protein
VTNASTKWIPRKVGIVVGFVALAALPALGVGVFAAADAATTGTNGEEGARPARPELTDAQKQCLADHGVTLPQRPADGSTGERPAPPTAEQRDALRAAAAACGITIPEHGPRLAGRVQGTAV